MAKRTTKKALKPVRPQLGDGVEILNAGSVLEDPITRTLETNYMPYAMSVIVSRALPEIDGFKPAHRKLLYTMYGMGLLKGARTKSANIVGSTMHLNPHGDAAIYDTMVRMGRGNESLLVPYVDSKGNFGKAYSRDMSCAAARYTEAKLEGVCEELFRDIDRETVDFVPNYDGTTTEPTLLPVTFPTILANNTLGIAVGMACNICSFNLAELCNTTIALMKDPRHDISTTMPAPDFVGGGQILYDEAQMREIYENGRGSVRVRARYNVVPGENMLEITQIPPTTTVEAIMDKIAELVKAGKIKEISDMRDETDLNGLKLTLDLKRGVDAEKLMAKLFKTTPLEDSFSANFNILVSGQPKVMGVREILNEWTAFRMECVRRRTFFDLHGKEKRLHLLQGLAAILLDIDKAIHIIRTTEEETEVVPNLMIGFGIDEGQAGYVAEIKLRHLAAVGEVVLLGFDEVIDTVQGHTAVVADDTAAAVGVGQTGDDVAVAGLLHLGSVGIKHSLVMGTGILGKDLVQLFAGLIAVGRAGLLSHLDAAVGHESTLQGLIGLQADDLFQVLQLGVNIAGAVCGQAGDDFCLHVQYAALGTLFLLQLLQGTPQLVGSIGGASQEAFVTVVGGVVLLDEVAGIDFLFPDTAFKAFPLFEICHIAPLFKIRNTRYRIYQ